MLGAAGARSVKQLLGAKHMALTLEPGAPLAPRGVGQFAAVQERNLELEARQLLTTVLEESGNI